MREMSEPLRKCAMLSTLNLLNKYRLEQLLYKLDTDIMNTYRCLTGFP